MTRAGVGSPAAVRAFDATATDFDVRFGKWASVAAQRRAVRRHLLRTFPPDSHLLELGGGTGDDAVFLARRDRHVLVTDGSPEMVRATSAKITAEGLDDRLAAERLLLEELPGYSPDAAPFDGAYSNFAALNCVGDLAPIGRGLARVLRPGAAAVLVLFGPFPPGEAVVQLLRGDVRAAFRRRSRGPVAAKLGGRRFRVWYPRPRDVAAALAPWFRLERTRGIGIFVPPSAAEPQISRFPRVLRVLEALDRLAAAPLALLGDHVLLHFVRTQAAAAEQR